MRIKLNYIGEILARAAYRSTWMDLTVVPSDLRTGLNMEIGGLEDEGIKKINLEIAPKKFFVMIERIDDEIILIERDPDNEEVLEVSKGLFRTKEGLRSDPLRAKPARVQRFPFVFGKEKVKVQAE